MRGAFGFVVAVCCSALLSSTARGEDSVPALVAVVNGSDADFTASEKRDAIRDLSRLAVSRDDAARALLAIANRSSANDDAIAWAAWDALRDVRRPVVTQAVRARLDALNLKDERGVGDAADLCRRLSQSGDTAAIPSILRVVDDATKKEVRVDCLRALHSYSPGFGRKAAPAVVEAATSAVVRYVDHAALGPTARDVLGNMRFNVETVKPLLTHKDAAVRAFATRLLDETGDPAVNQALVRQLADATSDADRNRALRQLGRALCGAGSSKDRCRDERALIAAVRPHLKNAATAKAALDALARVRDPGVVKDVTPLLEHSESSVREAAAKLLGAIGDKSAKPALWKRLEATRLDGNWSELDALFRGYVSCGLVDDDAPALARFLGRDDHATTSFLSNHREFWAAAARLSPRTAAAYVPLLRHKSRDLKVQVAGLLGALGNAVAVVPLLDLVEQKDEAAAAAATAVGSCAEAESLPRMEALLQAQLKRASWDGGGPLALSFVRADRAFGLQKTLQAISRHELLGIELLRALLKETHPSDARAFAHAFAQKIRDPSQQHTYRVLAVMGFAQIDTRQSLETLCQWARSHSDDSVRKSAAVGLQRFPEPQAVGCMVEALAKARDDQKSEIGRALEAATGQELGTDVAAWRTFVQGGLGLKACDAALGQGLSHPQPGVRALSARRLGELKKGLQPLIDRLPREDDAGVREALLGALAAHEDPSAKPALLVELEKKRAGWTERVLLARTLERLGDGRGTLAVLKLLDDRDAAVQHRAVVALSEITGEPPTASPAFWRAWWKTHAERYRFVDSLAELP